MKNFLFRLAAFFALLFYSGNVLFAADWAQSFLAGQRTLDMYLERAKAQTSQERFDALVEHGLEASLCEWEQNALDLKLQGLEDWVFQRELAQESLKSRAQGVVSEWVTERKKSEVQEIQKSALYSELKKLADEFNYLAPNGSETRIVSKDQIAQAKDQYQKKAQEIVGRHLAGVSWDRAALEASLVESQALNELTSALLYDHNSLKKESDSQAALFIADKLASQIESESGRAMDQLFNSLQSQVDFASANDVQAKKEAEQNWLSRFENELNLGLKKWNDAEDEFLAARSEWEKNAENVYVEDSQKWQEAYDDLQNRKIAWSQKIEAQIQEGKLEWRNKLDVLENEIDQYLLEFQEALFWESEQRRQIIQSREDAYAQTRSILATAQRGVEIWYERWGEKYKGLYSYWKTEDTDFGDKINLCRVGTSYLRNEIISWRKTFANSLNDCYSQIGKKKYAEFVEEQRWKATLGGKDLDYDRLPGLYSMYPPLECSTNSSVDKIGNACQMVLQDKSYVEGVSDEYWNYIKDDRALWNAHSELFDWLDIFDEFYEKTDGPLLSMYSNYGQGVQIYDELSSQKAKASWLVDYWSSRVQIAQAVVDYAQNPFSDLESAERTENNLKAALERYRKAKADYQESYDKTQMLRLDVLAEQEKYMKVLSDSQDFLERIDSERRVYDSLWQEKHDVLSAMSKDTSLELIIELESLNYQSESFIKYLWQYCSEEQDSFDKNLDAQRNLLRQTMQNGFEDSSLEENAVCLSMARLAELENDLNGILAAAFLDCLKIKDICLDFEKMDPDLAMELKNKLLDFEDSVDGAEVEVKNSLEKFKIRIQREMQNRRAVILLFDGSAQEIHDLFDGNAELSGLYQEYKGYSLAITKEEADAALSRIRNVIAQGQKQNLDAYFSQLDQASNGASAFALAALKLYKELLLCQRDCAGLEESIGPKLLACETWVGAIERTPVNWFCDECESLLVEDQPQIEASGYDRNNFERLSFGRKELLLQIQERLDFMLNSANRAEELKLALDRQGDAVQALQKQYESCLEQISSGTDGEQRLPYILACERYVDSMNQSQEIYARLENARRDYRLAQEIWFYAQNEYLHDSYDPNESLSACKNSLQNAVAGLDALNSIKQEKAGAALDEYKNACLEYYKGQAVSFEYSESVSEQMERLCKAQEAERAAAEKLVSECVSQGQEAKISCFTKDLILAGVDQNGNYSFTLNKELVPLSQENERLLTKYFSDYCLVDTDVYQNEYLSTKAKKDALAFWEELERKPYSLVDLAFCALHIKTMGNESQKTSWFKSSENPDLNECYKIGDLPGSVQGLDVADLYHGERLNIIKEAYDRVISLGGEGDIAKFILYCDQSFSLSLDLDRCFRNALIVAAMKKPIDEVHSEYKSNDKSARDFFALSAMYSLLTCLPFGIGAWAAPLAAAAFAMAMVYDAIANQFKAYLKDMKSVWNGCKINLEKCIFDRQAAFEQWQTARKNCETESKKLNVLLTGKEFDDGNKITWNDFQAALKQSYETGSLCVDRSWYMSVFSKDLFDELSAKEDFFDVKSAMQKMESVLKDKNDQKKGALEGRVAAFDGDLLFDKGSYYKDLLSFYSKDLLLGLPIAKNRNQESYMERAFGLYNSLAQEAMWYSDKNRFEQERDICSLVYADMDEQRSLWEGKNQIVLKTADADWAFAQEQINFSYNSWQNKFSLDYRNASQEWESNYKDFLDKKDDWIFKQYLSCDSQADVSFSLVENLKPSFELDELCDMDKFSRLSALTSALGSFSQDDFCSQNFFEKVDISLIKDYGSAIKAQRQLQQKVQDAAAKAALQQSQAALEKQIKGAFDAIQTKNKSVENWELDMVRQAGYTVDSLIHRDAIVDVCFFGTKRDRQTVHRYEWFAPSAPSYEIDLSNYYGSGDYFIMKKMEEARQKVQDWSQEIFGTDASPKSGGRLAEHIGQAPVFVQNIDPTESRESNVKDFGSGQMGKILLDFQWNSIVSAAAASDLSRPVYEQKLMDLGGFAFPSLREIIGLVCDIVSKFPIFFSFQYIDDIVFGALDVQLGYKTWGEVMGDMAKQGIVSGISVGIGCMTYAAGEVFEKGSKFFKEAANGYLSNVASNYVQAFDFASGKMDWERAAASWYDAGAIASAAGSVLTQGLGVLNNVDANGLALNSQVFGNIQAMNATIGSLAGQGLNYLATGDFKINLLNIKGVGIFEIGVSDGEFKAGVGRGGANLSVQNVLSSIQGAAAASKVMSLKKSGIEGQSVLNATNLLAWSGGKENVALASDLFKGERSLAFEEDDSAPAFGRTKDGSIILNKALLEQGKEGQAMVAAYAAYQNLAQKDSDAKFDTTLASMAQISSVLAVASKALDFDLSAVQDKNSLTVLADAYKQNGMAGVYAICAEAQKQAEADGQKSASLAQLADQPWFQNVAENRGILLGQSMTMEEYNNVARQTAADLYANKKVKEFLDKNGENVSPDEIKRVGDEARAKALSEIVEGVANKTYGYNPETYSLDIKNYGCTLATAAYIAYSITGKVSTLAEANDILKNQDLFVYGVDNNGVTQKNLLAAGDNYASAVNAIAGGDYLQKDGKDFSVNADIKDGDGKVISDNRQSIFDRLIKNSKQQDEVYFAHMRVNDSHSVLFDSLTYTDQNNYKTSTLSVMDPWQGGKYSPKSWSDISRADFYKLTQAGKELYQLTRESLRSGEAA
ncbi:MAG: hypothetical protein IK015_06925 [Treponema sp.]|nr:hypothetical protein [Treponema sp.]